tara:strand:+ start:36 stop:275 length:240 start_codon:yes stop_codon:yes gene_type:complete
MTKRRKIVLDNSSRMMKAISLKSDRYVFEAIINEIIEEAINYTHCCKSDSEQLCDHKFENNGKGAEVCIKCELPFSINC